MARERGTVSERIVQQVAKRRRCDVLELPPLYDAIDPEALDRIVEEGSGVEISFMYGGQEVAIERDGSIYLDDQPTDCTTADAALSDD